MCIFPPEIGTHTLHLLVFSGRFMEITGEHSVIPYHSTITHFGTFSPNISITSAGHFSAHTTAYLRVASSFFGAFPRIILRKVGVAVRVVAPVFSMR